MKMSWKKRNIIGSIIGVAVIVGFLIFIVFLGTSKMNKETKAETEVNSLTNVHIVEVGWRPIVRQPLLSLKLGTYLLVFECENGDYRTLLVPCDPGPVMITDSTVYVIAVSFPNEGRVFHRTYMAKLRSNVFQE